MSDGAEPPQRVAVDAGPIVAVGRARCRCGRRAAAGGRGRGRCGPPRCRRRGRPSSHGTARRRASSEVGDRALVVADRRDVDQLGGERAAGRSPRHDGGAVLAQEVVELRLVVALAFGEPLDDEHARAGRTRRPGTRGVGWPAPRRTTAARRRGRAPRRSRRRSPGCVALRMTPAPRTAPSPDPGPLDDHRPAADHHLVARSSPARPAAARARRRCRRRRTGGRWRRSGRTTRRWPRCRPSCPRRPGRRCSRSSAS